MITVIITLGVIFGAAILFGVGFLGGANYVLSKQGRKRREALEQERVAQVSVGLNPPPKRWEQ